MNPLLLLLLATPCIVQSSCVTDKNRTHPVPKWFLGSKLGIICQWSVTNVPGFGTYQFWWNWAMEEAKEYTDFILARYKKTFQFPDFAAKFEANLLDTSKWAKLFHLSRARFVVLTVKHFDGYTLWPSKYSGIWNSVDFGPKQNILESLRKSVRDLGMKFGVHYSLFNMNPLFLDNFTKYWTDFSIPELMDVVNQAQPDLLLGSYSVTHSELWNSKEFLCWLYNQSPVKDEIVLSTEFACEKDFNNSLSWKYEYSVEDDQEAISPSGMWAIVLDLLPASGVFRREAYSADYLSAAELIHKIIHIVSSGGTAMIAISPRSDGMIDPIAELRLRQIGQWLAVNEEAIFDTEPLLTQQSEILRYTSRKVAKGVVNYAIIIKWPEEDRLTLSIAAPNGKDLLVTLVGWHQELNWRSVNGTIQVTLPKFTPSSLPCQWAWVVKIQESNNKLKRVHNRQTTATPSRNDTTIPKPDSEKGQPSSKTTAPTLTTTTPSITTAKSSLTTIESSLPPTEPSVTTTVPSHETDVTSKPPLNKTTSSSHHANEDEEKYDEEDDDEDEDDEEDGEIQSITSPVSSDGTANATEVKSTPKKAEEEVRGSNKTDIESDASSKDKTEENESAPHVDADIKTGEDIPKSALKNESAATDSEKGVKPSSSGKKDLEAEAEGKNGTISVKESEPEKKNSTSFKDLGNTTYTELKPTAALNETSKIQDGSKNKTVPASNNVDEDDDDDEEDDYDDDDDDDEEEDPNNNSEIVGKVTEPEKKDTVSKVTQSLYNIPQTTTEIETTTLPTTTTEFSNETESYPLITPDFCQFWYGRIYCCRGKLVPKEFDALYCKALSKIDIDSKIFDTTLKESKIEPPSKTDKDSTLTESKNESPSKIDIDSTPMESKNESPSKIETDNTLKESQIESSPKGEQ